MAPESKMKTVEEKKAAQGKKDPPVAGLPGIKKQLLDLPADQLNKLLDN